MVVWSSVVERDVVVASVCDLGERPCQQLMEGLHINGQPEFIDRILNEETLTKGNRDSPTEIMLLKLVDGYMSVYVEQELVHPTWTRSGDRTIYYLCS